MGKFSEYKIALQLLPQGNSAFEWHLGKEFFTNMENADIHDADLQVKLDVTRRGDLYHLSAKVDGTLLLLCDRCLDTLEWPVDAEYDIDVKFGDDYNDESDTLLVIPENDPVLNMAYMIYDTVVLTIPMRHVHPVGKCNRAMSAVLKKHRAAPDSDDAALQDNLLNELDNMEAEADNEAASDASEGATDPRWDTLRDFGKN